MTASHLTVFRNKGILDFDALTTFGVSVKETSNPIGQFGTGLKYAIAVLLREGCEVEIYLGGIKWNVETRESVIRDKTFLIPTLVCENLNLASKVALPFTTELGKNWQLWMAFRELYSNVLDENGSCTVLHITEEDEESYQYSDETVIIVRGEDFADIAYNKDQIFLENKAVIETYSISASEGVTNSVFNQNIKVAELELPLMHSYNLNTRQELTEDRTLKDMGVIDFHLVKMITESEDEEFIDKMVTASETYHESKLDFRYAHLYHTLSNTFKNWLNRCIRKKGINSTAATLHRSLQEAEERAERDKRVATVTVTLTMPKNANIEDVMSYVESAVKSRAEGLSIDDPMFHLDESTVKVEV